MSAPKGLDDKRALDDGHQLRALLRRHEGVRHLPYLDSVGKITIGVGRNLSDRGLNQDEVSLLFETDVNLAATILDSLFADWHSYPRPVRHGLLSMAFNLGGPRLMRFKKMRAALEKNDFETAALEAENSLWAKQLPARSTEIAAMFRQGVGG